MESIISFLSLAVSGFFGGLTVKYTDYFFKNSNERLEKLEKAYLSTSSLTSFANQSTLFLTIFIYCERSNLSKESLKEIKVIENPLPQLIFLLDFHLDAPIQLSAQLQLLENTLIEMTKPMAAPFIKDISIEDMYAEAINQALVAKKLSVKIQKELQEWIIAERNIMKKRIDFITLIKSCINTVKRWINEKRITS